MRTVLNMVMAAGVATIGALAAFDSAAQVYSPDCPIAGRYSVVGRVPGESGQYTGEAIITARGGGCFMKWFPPNASEGTGTYSGNVLTINFTFENGGSGIVKYTRAGNGELHGTWWMLNDPDEVGTETLRPISYAPR